MLLTSIETTPNPNSMKLNFDETVIKAVTYTPDQVNECPTHIAQILRIDGVKSVFACSNFATVNKDPKVDWKMILDLATLALSSKPAEAQVASPANAPELISESKNKAMTVTKTVAATEAERVVQREIQREAQREAAAKLGQATVLVQTFKGVPIQVKVTDQFGEKRVALAARFNEAAQAIQTASGSDFLKDRYWADWGVRYGAAEEIAAEVLEELNASIDLQDLERLVALALGRGITAETRSLESVKQDLQDDSWQKRLKAVQDLATLDMAVEPLITALKDDNHQVRRLAAAALGATGEDKAVHALSHALLNDHSVAVRRTAGDALSDIGSASAEKSVCKALVDSNKLVRWRAARFLTDLGTDYALPFLKKALGDDQFEVNLEVEAAIERISGGKIGALPMWKQIAESKDSPKT